MTRLFSKIALTALLASAIVGQAEAKPSYPRSDAKKQAHVVWHFPYKAAPYGVWVQNYSVSPKRK